MDAQAHYELPGTTPLVRGRANRLSPIWGSQNPQPLLQKPASPLSLGHAVTHLPADTTLVPDTELKFVSPRASLEAQHSGFPAMYQERFQSLLAFAYQRAGDCSEELDQATWITLHVTELAHCSLAKHGPNADPQQIHRTFWRMICGEPDLMFSLPTSLKTWS